MNHKAHGEQVAGRTVTAMSRKALDSGAPWVAQRRFGYATIIFEILAGGSH